MAACRSLIAVAVLGLPLAGCAGTMPNLGLGELLSGLSARLVPPPVGAPPVVQRPATDPLSQFALASGPGTEGEVVLANGVSERARVLRAYHAASGRECREILLGQGGAERSELICGDISGFEVARPLLRSGGIGGGIGSGLR